MSKTLMIALVLLASAAWLQAQQYPPTGSSHGTSSETKVEGCLQASSGSYTLTAKSGMVYRLEGDTAKLAEHVGHEVAITGTTSPATATATGSKASTAGSASEHTLNVKDVKHISKTCKSTSK